MTRLAQRLMGSPDIYGGREREPEQSVNFVTCHDGFSLNDLVSYNHKHNETNGEENRDGTDYSCNYGVEGETEEPEIETVRKRQIKNFLLTLFISRGVPMLLGGDEFRRTQRGNNNAYCQDNETSWFDWSLLTRHADMLRFTKSLIALRLSRRYAKAERSMTLNELLRKARMSWHGVKLGEPDWADHSHSLAVTLEVEKGLLFHIMLSSYWGPLEFELPPTGSARGSWRRLIDTSLESPDDFCAWNLAPRIAGDEYQLQSYSVAILFAHATEEV